MILTAAEYETLLNTLWSNAQLWAQAFGIESATAHFLLAVVDALERGEPLEQAAHADHLRLLEAEHQHRLDRRGFDAHEFEAHRERWR